jgi:hypothetical protein
VHFVHFTLVPMQVLHFYVVAWAGISE